MEEEDIHICEICKKPVLSGEARYGITGDHYHCKFPNGQRDPFEDFRKSVKEVDDGLKRVRRMIRDLP